MSLFCIFCVYFIIVYDISYSSSYVKPKNKDQQSSKSTVASDVTSKGVIEINLSTISANEHGVKGEGIEHPYIKTRDEVLLTKVVTIDAKPCNSGQSLAVFIHSSAHSRGKYFENRQFLRNAWIRQLKDRNVSFYFLIGLNSDPLVNRELRSEADKYSDLIQFGFIDHYYNLTLKSISMLRWIQSKCPIYRIPP